MGLWEHLAVFVLPLVPVSENSALIWALLGGMYGRCVIEDYFPSIFSLPLSLSFCSPRRLFSAVWHLSVCRFRVLHYLKKVVGGRKHTAAHQLLNRHIWSHTRAHTHTHWQEQTHSLHAEKKTKCQGWFWETTAGAAVGMETAVV